MALPSNQKASFGLNSMLGVLLFMEGGKGGV